MSAQPAENPTSFVEMLQQSAEHLGRLQLGKFMVCRDVIKCYIATETGEWACDLVVRTADLPPDVLRRLWAIEVDLAAAVAPAIQANAAHAMLLLVDASGSSSATATSDCGATP